MTRVNSWISWLGGTSRRTAVAAALLAAVCAAPASAGPEGWQVINGTAVFTHNGTVYIIEASHNAVIDYSAFNIESWETVQFIQPGSWARVLNRINGADPSSINGTLIANGLVYFVNPAGIIFGNGSVVDVGGIYAAAGHMNTEDFLGGVDRFSNLSGPVVNNGLINAKAVHLIGQHVANHGTINAPQGIVTMLAGNDVLMQQQGDTMFVKIDGHQLTGQDYPSGGGTAPSLTATPGVVNTGTINTQNGTVMLGAGDFYSLAIQNTGLIQAESGNVTLAASDGVIHNAGTIDVSSANGPGGSITVQGPSVVNSGTLAADSVHGQAGTIELTSQNHTYMLDGSRVSAAGLGSGSHGGEILIHSYGGLTVFADGAVVDVSAGAGGTGGFAEVSGHSLYFRGHVKLRGDAGSIDGTLLIDPLDIHIVNPNDPNVAQGNALFLGQGGEVLFGDPDTFNTIYIGADVIETFIGTIILQAYRDFFVSWALSFNPNNNNNITFEAGRHMYINAPITGATAITLRANAAFGDPDYAGIGDLWVGDAATNNFISLSTPGALILSGANINVSANLTGAGIELDLSEAGGLATFTGPGLQTVNGTTGGILANGDIVKGAGPLTLIADGTLDLEGVEATTGALTLQSNNGDLFTKDLLAGSSVMLGGTNMTLGNVQATTGLLQLVAGGTASTGNLIAGGDVNASASSLTVTGDVEAGFMSPLPDMGDVIFNAPVSVSGNVTGRRDVIFNSTADVGGTVQAIKRDVLFGLHADLGGDVLAGRDVTFFSSATFDGILGTQRVEAMGGTLSAAGTLTKTTTGDLELASDVLVNLDGTLSADVQDGSLIVEDMADIEGNLSASENITFMAHADLGGADITAGNDVWFQSSANLDALGLQRIEATAGTLRADGFLNKTLNNTLELNAGMLIDLNALGLSVASLGNLVLESQVEAEGDVGSGLGSITFKDHAELAGNVTAFNDVWFQSSATLDGMALQRVQATTGTLRADGLLQKTTDFTLELAGGNLIDLNALGQSVHAVGDVVLKSQVDAEGDLDSTMGSITFQQHANLAGNVTAANDVWFQSTATLDGGPLQRLQATTGTLQADGQLTKITTGTLELAGGMLVDLNDAATSVYVDDGDLLVESATFDAEGDVQVWGSATIMAADAFVGDGTDGDVWVFNDVTFHGTSDVTRNVTAATGMARFIGQATVGNDVFAGTDAIFEFDNAFVGRDVLAGGAVSFQNTSTVGRNVLAVGDVSFGDDGTVGNLVQGDNVSFGHNADVETAVFAFGDASFGNGAMIGDVGLGTGLVEAFGQITFGHDATVGTSVYSLNSGITLGDDATIGDAVEAAGPIQIGDRASVTSHVSSFGSSATLGDDATIGTFVTANTDASFGDRATVGTLVWAGDNASFGQDATVGQSVTAVSGSATFGDAATVGTFVLAGQNATFGDDATVGDFVDGITGDVLFGNDATVGTFVHAGQNATFGHDATIGAFVEAKTGNAAFGDRAFVNQFVDAGQDAFFGDQANIRGNVTAGNDVLFMGDSKLGGNVTAGHDAEFVGDVTLDGANSQRLAAEGGILTLGSNVAKTQANSGSLNFFADTLIAIFGSSIFATDDISFNTTDPAAGVPVLATVAAHGDLAVESGGGDINFGSLEKFAVDGNMMIKAPGTITVGDLSSSGSITVDAPTILIRLRDAGFVAGSGGLELDEGVDIVARTGLNFTSTPNLLANPSMAVSRQPQFTNGSADNISLGTLQGFIIRIDQSDPSRFDLDVPGFITGNGQVDRRLRDLRASGTSITDISDALAGATPRETERDDVGQGITVGRADLETLRRLGINARLLDPAEELTRVGGFGLYDDFDRVPDPLNIQPGDRPVALPRMEPGKVIEAVKVYQSEMPQEAIADRFLTPIGRAWLQFQEEVAMDTTDAAARGRAFRQYVDTTEGLEDARAAVRATERVLMSVQVLGLTRPEMVHSSEIILEQAWPSDVMPFDAFRAMFVAFGGGAPAVGAGQ